MSEMLTSAAAFYPDMPSAIGPVDSEVVVTLTLDLTFEASLRDQPRPMVVPTRAFVGGPAR